MAEKSSKFSDLPVFMEQSILKKVRPPNINSVCLLCGDAFESRHLLRVFGRGGRKREKALGTRLTLPPSHNAELSGFPISWDF